MHYEMMLENEVPVTRDYMTNLFDKNEVFVLGYGSLLYTSGWLSRNMSSVPRKDDLQECIVDGYERGTYGVYNILDSNAYIHFYGVIRNESTSINGVLVRIRSLRDWCSLMATECIAGFANNYTYRCVDITKNIRGVELKEGQVVHVVANEPRSKHEWQTALPAKGYYEKVARGVNKERSIEFRKMFYKTGGVSLKQAEIMRKAGKLKGSFM